MTKKNEVAIVQRNNTLPMTRPESHQEHVNPFVDIYETPEAFVLMVDMPGTTKDSIKITVERGVLTVRAAVEPYHRESATLLLSELRAIQYYRVFNLADGIDRSIIDATYEQGILTIKLFKSEELKPREIRIK